MSYVVVNHKVVDGEVLCTMMSIRYVEEAIDIANYHKCNVIIRYNHVWKIMKAEMSSRMISSPGSIMYVLGL